MQSRPENLESNLTTALAMLLPDDADPLLLRFSTYWLNARGSKIVPAYRDLDPVQMPWALPFVFVLEREQEDMFRYRLVGEDMQTRLSSSMRGKTAFDIFEPSYAEWTEQRWKRAADELLASYVYTRHETADGRHIISQRILFPAVDQAGTTRFLIGVSSFDNMMTSPGLGVEDIEKRKVRWTKISDLPYLTDRTDAARL